MMLSLRATCSRLHSLSGLASTVSRRLSTQVTEKKLSNGGMVAHISFAGDKKYPIAGPGPIKSLREEIISCSQNHTLKAIFVRSIFAGADLKYLKTIDGPVTAQDFIRSVDMLCSSVQYCAVPVVQIIDGPCLGAGMELAAACDLRIAVEGSVFGMPETRLGLPSPAQAALFPGLVGSCRARELLYFGETYDAKTMLQWGFVNTTVSRADLEGKIQEWEGKFDAVSNSAVRAQKALIMKWEELGTGRARVEAGEQVFAEAYRTNEPNERIQAFLEANKSSKKT